MTLEIELSGTEHRQFTATSGIDHAYIMFRELTEQTAATAHQSPSLSDRVA